MRIVARIIPTGSAKRQGRTFEPVGLEREYVLFGPHLLVCHDRVPIGVRNRAFIPFPKYKTA